MQIMKMALGDKTKGRLGGTTDLKEVQNPWISVDLEASEEEGGRTSLNVAPNVPRPQTATSPVALVQIQVPTTRENVIGPAGSGVHPGPINFSQGCVGCHLPILGGFREREVLVLWQHYHWVGILVYTLDIYPSDTVHSWKIKVMAENLHFKMPLPKQSKLLQVQNMAQRFGFRGRWEEFFLCFPIAKTYNFMDVAVYLYPFYGQTSQNIHLIIGPGSRI